MIHIGNLRGDRIKARPHPSLGQRRQGRGVQRLRLLVLALAPWPGLPLGAPLPEDALQQYRGRLVGTALPTGQLRLCGDQAALARGLEHAGAVALQVGPRPLERGDGGVQPGEVFLDLRHDAVLLWEGWDWQPRRGNVPAGYSLACSASLLGINILSNLWRVYHPA